MLPLRALGRNTFFPLFSFHSLLAVFGARGWETHRPRFRLHHHMAVFSLWGLCVASSLWGSELLSLGPT